MKYKNIKTGVLVEPSRDRLFIKDAKDLFEWIAPDFKEVCNDYIVGPSRQVKVNEILENGTFKDFFVPKDGELDSLCLTQAEIIGFLMNNKSLLSREWEGGTHFLLKNGLDFFVAHVFVSPGGRLRVYLYRFSSDGVWDAGSRRRIVIPQGSLKSDPQTLKPFEPSKKELAHAIGSLLINVGNVYNELGEDITKEVGEYIHKNYKQI